MAGFALPSDSDPNPPSSAGETATTPSFVLPSDMDNQTPAAPQTWGGTAVDAAKSLGSGIAQGEAGVAALPRTLHDAAAGEDSYPRQAVRWAMGQTAGRLANYLKTGSADAEPVSQIAAHSAAVDQQAGVDKMQMPDYSQTLGAVQKVTGPLYTPQTETGRYAEKVGEYIPGTVLGGGGIGSAVGSAVGDEALGNLTKGSAYEPWARAAGAVAGGIGGAGATAAARSALPAISERAAAQDAAKIIGNASSDPAALKAAAVADTSDALPSNRLLPGWNETTAQRFNDQGLLDLEKAVQTRNPSAFVDNQYGTGTAQQNAVGEGYINSLKGAGDPTDVPALFMRQKQAIEAAHDDAMSRISRVQQGLVSDIGGDQSPAAIGRSISGDLGPQYTAAQQGARQAVADLGGAANPDVYGSTLRNSAQTARTTESEALGNLFKAVPDTVTTSIAPVKQAATDIYKDMSPAKQATVSPLEQTITSAIAKYPDNIPFGHARDIDALITSSMRQELRSQGSTPAYARMVQMKGAWEHALSDAIDNQHGLDQQAVAAGTMSPEDAMVARLAAHRDDFNATQSLPTARANVAGGNGSDAAAGPSNVPGSFGAQSPGGSRSGAAAGDQGLQGDASRAISQADRDALAVAKQGTKDFKNTFGKGPVGDILKSDGTSGSYKTLDSAVTAKVFPSGPNGNLAVQAYKKAVGDDAAASDALHNYAASTLRKVALNDHGTLNPTGYAKWRNTYGPAISALPADVQSRFASAGAARSALDRFGDFTPGMRAHEVPELFFAPGPAGSEGVHRLRQLIGPEKADAALSDYAASMVKGRAANPDGTINQAQLKKFVDAHDDALNQFPQLKKQLSDIGGTNKLLADVAVNRKQTLETFQNGAAKKFLNLEDGSEVRDAVGRMIDANNVTGIKKLMQAVKSDPTAEAGLKRAAADHMANKWLSESSQAGATGSKDLMRGTFMNTLNDKRAALSQFLSKDQMQGLDMLRAGIQSSNKTTYATKIKGSPNTAADYIRAMKFAPHHDESLFRKLAEGVIAGSELGGESGSIVAATLAVGNHLKSAIRDAGMRKTYELIERAILDPQFGKTLIAKAPLKPNVGSEITAANKLGAYSMFRAGVQAPMATSTSNPEDRPAYANGGAVRGTYALGGVVNSNYRPPTLPPQAGGPVVMGGHNPKGLPTHDLTRISNEVRAGVRAPQQADNGMSDHIRAALDIAAQSGIGPRTRRSRFADGGFMNHHTDSTLDAVLGLPRDIARRDVGPISDEAVHRLNGIAELNNPAFGYGNHFDGEDRDHELLARIKQPEAIHRAHGGAVHYGRPHFEDGGSTGGDNSGDSSGNAGGVGGIGGSVGGYGNSNNGYGGMSTGMSSSGSFGIGGPNTSSAGNYGSPGGIGGMSGGVNSSAANNASTSVGNSSGYGNTSSGSFGSLGSHSTSSPSSSSGMSGGVGGFGSDYGGGSGVSSGMSSGASGGVGGFGGDSYGGGPTSGMSSGMSGGVGGFGSDYGGGSTSTGMSGGVGGIGGDDYGGASNSFGAVGFGGFGFGGINAPGSPAANSMGSIGQTSGMSSPGVTGMLGGINSGQANGASAAAGYGAGVGLGGTMGVMGGAATGPSASGFGTDVGGVPGSISAPSPSGFNSPMSTAGADNMAISRAGFGTGPFGSIGGFGDTGYSVGIGHFGINGPATASPSEYSAGIAGGLAANGISAGLAGPAGQAAMAAATPGYGPNYGGVANTDPNAGTGFGMPANSYSAANPGQEAASAWAGADVAGPNTDYGPALTIHQDPRFSNAAYNPGMTDAQAFAYSHDLALQAAGFNDANGYNATARAALAGNISREAGTIGVNGEAAGPNNPGLAGSWNTGALAVNDAGPGYGSFGLNQSNRMRATGLGQAAGISGLGNQMSPADQAAYGAALAAAPASEPAQLSRMYSEIQTPAYASVNAVLHGNDLGKMNQSLVGTYEGARDVGPDVAAQNNYSRQFGSNLANVGATTMGTQTAFSGPATSPAAPSTGPSDAPAAPASTLASAPAETTQADISKMTPEQKNAYDNSPDPKNPGFTHDGTPLTGAGISGPETSPTATVNPHVTNTIANIGLGMLGPIGGIAALGNFASGMLGGPTIGDGINGLAGGMGDVGLGSAGTPANSLGSNNSRGMDSPQGNYVQAPPASTKAKSKKKDKPVDTPAADPVTDPTAAPTWYNPTYLTAMPPSVAQYVPYNPMTDPSVLRALGYAA